MDYHQHGNGNVLVNLTGLCLYLGTSSRVSCLFEYWFEFAEISDYEIADIVVSGVNDTADQSIFSNIFANCSVKQIWLKKI
jgi:hypothetical protein